MLWDIVQLLLVVLIMKKKRQEAFERLAMDEADATEEMQPLDYIFLREIY